MTAAPPQGSNPAVPPAQPVPEVFTIETLDQLRVVADPLRQRLLTAFAQPGTVKAVAARLAEPLTKLYHHVDQLERAGLIRVVSQRKVRGTVERTLQATARRFAVAPDVLSTLEAKERLQKTRQALAVSALQDLIRSAGEDAPPLRMIKISARLSPTALDQLETKLREMLRNLADADAPEAEVMLIAAPRALKP